MSTALVTGASGFIGSQLCQLLKERGYSVRTCSRTAQGPDNIPFDFVKMAACPVEVCADVDIVFHLAGKAHALAKSHQDAAEYREINTDGTHKLLVAAQLAGVKKFVFFSSVKAVRQVNQQPMDETNKDPARDPYGSSKYDAEQLVLHGDFVPHPVVLRLSMVYGDTEKGNLPRMIGAIRRGIFPPLAESGNRRSMVHVADVVAAALLAAEKPESSGQTYIVTDQQSYSTRQIYDAIRVALGKPPVAWSVPLPVVTGLAKLGDAFGRLTGRRFPIDSDSLEKLTSSAWYSSAKIHRELGFQPRQTLWKALPDIIRHLN
ncbi:MAG: NAD-dependent dehydratase [Proteobacteria bacterium ST_bin11]|nr:MAG: NAD-dependent dehydratase [Proteobacteria bacterium ST_bin11]